MGKALTNEEVRQRVSENFVQKVNLIGDYVNRRTNICLKCLECGYEWTCPPASVIYNDHEHKCPNCGVKKGQLFKCGYCGKEVYRAPNVIEKNKTGFFYCSRECGNLHKNQLRKENGEWDNSLNYRKKAFETYEHKCAVCGWNEDEKVLEVHHIDENREHNTINNLIILCPICHKKLTLHLYKLTENYQLIKT